MDSSVLKELHDKELEILSVFVDVCKKLNIKYFAVYGTALGCVRHQGFIPWDDDIDVAMMRADFTRFIDEAPALLPKHLFLQTNHSDPNYNLSHAKLRDNNTTFLEPGWEEVKGHHGIFVDIFPWDYFPEKRGLGALFYLKRKFYQNAISINPKTSYIKRGGIKNVIKALLAVCAKIFRWDRHKVAQKFDMVLQRLAKSSKVGCHELKSVCYDITLFDDVVSLPFENMMLDVPKGVDGYLTACYGDYMKLPPENQREPKHLEVVDVKRSYAYYINRK